MDITNGSNTFPNVLVQFPWETTRDTRTVVHAIIGGGVDVTLSPALPRSGVLTVVTDTEALAHAIETAHANPAVWTLTGALATPVRYVARGSISVEQAEGKWLVDVPFQEVPA